MTKKVCTRCCQPKKPTDFNLKYDKRVPTARRSFCKTCERKKPSQMKAGNRKKVSKSQRQKQRAVEYLGGKCMNPDCPLTPHYEIPYFCYDFHHRNPAEKDKKIARMAAKSWASLKKELDKCDLLCCVCHRLEHYQKSKEI